MRNSGFATFASVGLVIGAALIAVAPVHVGRAQSWVQQRNAAAATLAEALRTAKPPYPETTFESTAAYDDLVVVNYVMIDSALFARVKSADANQLRQVRARDYCNDSRIAYLRQGIVVNEMFATFFDHNDRVSVFISLKACDDAQSALARYGCPTRPHFSECAPDDRRCEVASKIRGCISDDILFRMRTR
jgi:hypothetical protein